MEHAVIWQMRSSEVIYVHVLEEQVGVEAFCSKVHLGIKPNTHQLGVKPQITLHYLILARW